MGLIYDVGDIVTLKRDIHVEVKSGRSYVWELISV